MLIKAASFNHDEVFDDDAAAVAHNMAELTIKL